MIYAALYIILTALSVVFINELGNHIPAMLMIFIATSFTIVFFSAINFKSLFRTYRTLWFHKIDYFLLCFFLFCMWFGSFAIPIYFSPTAFLFPYMSLLATWGLLAKCFHVIRRHNIIKLILLLINLSIFYGLIKRDYTNSQYVILIVSTIATGTTGFIYIKLSGKLNNLGLKASQVLAVRFWILWLFSLISCLVNKDFSAANLRVIGQCLVVSLFSLILPIYFSQKSIEKLGANLGAITMGFTPLACFAIEKLLLKTNLGYELICSIILAVILLLPISNKN